MASRSASPSTEIRIQREAAGDTRVELIAGGRAVSRLFIVPFRLRIGAAIVRMDGIAGVETEQECRHQGYARRVLEATVAHMRDGDAALSMLYGIPDFYPKFGYATAGPEHAVELPGPFEAGGMPPGWRVRPFARSDLPAIRHLYDQNTARAVGAAVRPAAAGPWARLAEPEGKGAAECRVVEASDGQVRAYAWRARWHYYVGIFERHAPDALVLAEVMADGPAAADAVLAACRTWAAEKSKQRAEPIQRIILSLPPDGPVAAAAMYQGAHLIRRYQRCGGSMVRVLNMVRLFQSLAPELRNLQQTNESEGGKCDSMRV